MNLEKRIKIAVLYENWGEEETAPPPEPEKKRRAKTKRKKKREKHDHEEIFEALEKLGHQPSYQILDGTEKTLTALARCDADLFFNIVESYAGDDSKEMHVAAYLDLLGRPYTGAGPQAMYLAGDKALAKKIFEFHGVRTPFFAAVDRGTLEHSDDIKFPLIVKPTSEDASIGIDKDSVVESVKELMERIHYVQEEFDSPALIEEYIEGREIYGAILGNEDPEVLPLVELDLSGLPAGMRRVAGTEVKWDKDSEAYKLTKSAPVEDLDDETTERLSQTALAAYRALKLRDYARIDMRLTSKGEVYVIEANPNPWLSSNSEFYMAAKKSGRSYADMISEIVDLARSDRRRRDLMRVE
jgi:D-alanine-D-alanine ligase